MSTPPPPVTTARLAAPQPCGSGVPLARSLPGAVDGHALHTPGAAALGGLGFLGLGLPETVPEWGSDLQQALSALPTGIWWTALYPGVAMFVLLLGLSSLGEGLES